MPRAITVLTLWTGKVIVALTTVFTGVFNCVEQEPEAHWASASPTKQNVNPSTRISNQIHRTITDLLQKSSVVEVPHEGVEPSFSHQSVC
jgi:hypothetical protein